VNKHCAKPQPICADGRRARAPAGHRGQGPSLYDVHVDEDAEVTVTRAARALFDAMCFVRRATKSSCSILLRLLRSGGAAERRQAVHIPLTLPTSPSTGSRIGRISDRTRMIILNSPHNRRADVAARDLNTLAELIRDATSCGHDEVYEHIIFDGVRTERDGAPGAVAARDGIFRLARLPRDRWKVGYCVAPKALSESSARCTST